MLDVSILQFLFSVVAQLRDKYVKTFPVKKVYHQISDVRMQYVKLNIYASLYYSYGKYF